MVYESQIIVSECISGSSGTAIHPDGRLHRERAATRAEQRPTCCLTTTALSSQCKMAILCALWHVIVSDPVGILR